MTHPLLHVFNERVYNPLGTGRWTPVYLVLLIIQPLPRSSNLVAEAVSLISHAARSFPAQIHPMDFLPVAGANNAVLFSLLPGRPRTLSFLPFGAFDAGLFASSLRVEHLGERVGLF